MSYKAELMEDLPNNLILPSDSFVFYAHQGYVWYFFRTAQQADNPPVYACWGEYKGFLRLNLTLESFFEEYLNKTFKIEQYTEYLYYDPTTDDFVLIQK